MCLLFELLGIEARQAQQRRSFMTNESTNRWVVSEVVVISMRHHTVEFDMAAGQSGAVHDTAFLTCHVIE